ncbi:MAG: hypothetical protein LBM66_06000 [Bifidobacteriaceae bacterium]|jgi:hypothetical protein|nr:hypothetical protein [Bifidobacteriaceae bacterium]
MSEWVSARGYRPGAALVNAGRPLVRGPDGGYTKRVSLQACGEGALSIFVPSSKQGRRINKEARALSDAVRITANGGARKLLDVEGRTLKSKCVVGETSVTVVAHDGASSKVVVFVADYTRPVFNLTRMSDEVVTLLTTYYNNACDLASYVTIHRMAPVYLAVNADTGDLVVTYAREAVDAAFAEAARELMASFPYYLRISVINGSIELRMSRSGDWNDQTVSVVFSSRGLIDDGGVAPGWDVKASAVDQ